MLSPTRVALSGERFRVVYRLAGTEAQARARAEDICIEQTIEFPAELVPEDDIRGQIFGRIEDFRPVGPGHYEATISYANEISAGELPGLLNVVFGNISMKPGIRVERLDLSHGLLQVFRGPRFGRAGWRELLGISDRPLLCSALKPMGLPVNALADIAYRLALGGIDMIKDDHGLTDQSFSTFRERVEACAAAVARANREAGGRAIYAPHITAPADQVLDRARFAKQAGAGALVVAPGLVGFDTLRRLADDDGLGLPIMSHPAFLGSFLVSPNSGISHHALLGQITRLAGADATIFPNYGGRFSFTREDCAAIVEGTQVPMAHLKPIFPAPGGGMSLERVPEMLDLYGRDVVFLIGGGLHRHGPDLVQSSRHFRQLVERM